MDASGADVFAMSITPFTADGAIDEALLRAHLRFLCQGGAAAYVASQGSGEGDLLAFDEKVTVYRIAADELHGTCPVAAAGIGLAMSTATARELAVAADIAGVDAVQVLGPRPGPLGVRADELETWFRTVIEAVSCQVHLSTNGVLTGYEVPIELLERLIDRYPHVRAVNVTGADGVDVVARLADRVAVRVGMTAQLSRACAAGARGLLSFEANVAPAMVVEACRSGSLDGLLALNAALARGGNPRSLKAALALIGRDGGYLRAPYLSLPAEQQRELESDLRDVGVLQPPKP
jgi:4-hydroxy-tetrahydrodipicolinate synthase